MKEEKQKIGSEHLAKASASNLSVSTKHSVELCRNLRYKKTAKAKEILEGVIAVKKPIPFRRFTKDLGHKPGIGAGRYPQKAAKEFLKLVRAVENNAQFKGLNTSSLKIVKIVANKASVPMTGGRHRTSTKRTHLEIEVREAKEKKKEARGKAEPKKQAGAQKK